MLQPNVQFPSFILFAYPGPRQCKMVPFHSQLSDDQTVLLGRGGHANQYCHVLLTSHIVMSLEGVHQILECENRSGGFVYFYHPADLCPQGVWQGRDPDAVPGPVWIWCHRDGTQSQELLKEIFALARQKFAQEKKV